MSYQLRKFLWGLMFILELPRMSGRARWDVIWSFTCYPFMGTGFAAICKYWRQIRESKRRGWTLG